MATAALAPAVPVRSADRRRGLWRFVVIVVVVVALVTAWAVGRATLTPRFLGGEDQLGGPALVGVPYTDADGFVLTRLAGGVVNGFQLGDPRWHRSSHVVPLSSLKLSTNHEKPARYGEIVTVEAPGTYVIGFPLVHWRSGIFSGSAQGTTAITLTVKTGTPDYADGFLGFPPR